MVPGGVVRQLPSLQKARMLRIAADIPVVWDVEERVSAFTTVPLDRFVHRPDVYCSRFVQYGVL